MKNSVYPESFLENCLQTQLSFNLNNKTIKRGQLILYKRQHYYIQLSLLNDKNTRENFEIPIPFNLEFHHDERLVYFDYRIQSLKLTEPFIVTKHITSNFYNKILEIVY